MPLAWATTLAHQFQHKFMLRNELMCCTWILSLALV